MQKLTREDLYSLEDYAEARGAFRARVMEHKRDRQLALGPNATLYFEDRLTVQYQIQEMLRVEKIFERGGVEEELSAYNALIPDGHNFKATFMLEYVDVEERRQALARLIDIEDHVWVQVEGFERVFAAADEDLERETAEKTSAVHFLRFELAAPMVAALKEGAPLNVGVDHSSYCHVVEPVRASTRASLAADLEVQLQ